MLTVPVSAVRSTMASRTNVLKPASAAAMRYAPGGRVVTVYTPVSFVTVVRLTLVSTLVTAIVTPGTTAPWASVTRPVIVARNSCPPARAATTDITMAREIGRPRRYEERTRAAPLVTVHPRSTSIADCYLNTEDREGQELRLILPQRFFIEFRLRDQS